MNAVGGIRSPHSAPTPLSVQTSCFLKYNGEAELNLNAVVHVGVGDVYGSKHPGILKKRKMNRYLYIFWRTLWSEHITPTVSCLTLMNE